MSAAFSGPSRGLGTELYRGSMAYFNHVNDNGGVNGRKIVLKLHDDGYQPDPCVANTIKLMQDESVFLLFGYVGTPTVTRVLPLLKKFRDEQVYLFFPFTGAEPQREHPYGEFAFNLRASLPAGDGRPGRQLRRHRAPGGSRSSTRTTPTDVAAGRACARRWHGTARPWPARPPTRAAPGSTRA